MIAIAELPRNMPVKALLFYLKSKIEADSVKENYLFDCLWLLASDKRSDKMPRFFEVEAGRTKKAESGGSSGDEIIAELMKKLGKQG